jgi:hypothetical protein
MAKEVISTWGKKWGGIMGKLTRLNQGSRGLRFIRIKLETLKHNFKETYGG